MEIPVVFATDENYLFYTAVAITSMAENAKRDTFYKIYILVCGALEKGHRLLMGLQEKYANIEICLLPVKSDEFQYIHINNAHVTKATFYRLLLSELLLVEKCLYLDSDIIVNTDLQELYLTEMGEAYIAGVRDLWIDLMEEEKREERRKKTNIPSLKQYVNAGVLLFNLEKLRRDHLTERFRAHMMIDYPYEDQDIVNVCCYGHIHRLPAKWNLFTLFMGQLNELKQKGIDKDSIRYMKERRGIIHYATPLEKRVRQRDIGYSEARTAIYCTAYDKVYIWGFTAFGRSVMTALLERGTENIAGFIDHDEDKQKFTYCGKAVSAFEISNYEPGKCAVIIASQKRGEEIRKMLIGEGVLEEDIVCFVQKSPYYYQCLRPELREEENRGE